MKDYILQLIDDDMEHYKYFKLHRDTIKMEFYEGRLSALQEVLEHIIAKGE